MIPPEPGGRPLRALERAQDPAVEKVEGSFLGVESDGPLDFRERLGELSFANEHQGQVEGDGGDLRQERRNLAVGARGLFEAAVTLREDRSREKTLDALLREDDQHQNRPRCHLLRRQNLYLMPSCAVLWVPTKVLKLAKFVASMVKMFVSRFPLLKRLNVSNRRSRFPPSPNARDHIPRMSKL